MTGETPPPLFSVHVQTRCDPPKSSHAQRVRLRKSNHISRIVDDAPNDGTSQHYVMSIRRSSYLRGRRKEDGRQKCSKRFHVVLF